MRRLERSKVRRKRRYKSLALSLLILCLGLIILIVFNPNKEITSYLFTINLDNQKQLIGRIYHSNNPKPQPAILLLHGVNNSQEMMTPIALELARRGMAAIAFDFGGYGESYPLKTRDKSIDNLEKNTLKDAEAVLDFIRKRGDIFDLNRLGILGHSMGGATALQLARKYPQLRTTIVLGMSGIATTTVPKNLFLGVGLYEQINTPSELRAMLKTATNSHKPTCINGDRICGDFSTNTARKLFISGTADHITEPYDPQLMRQVVDWAQQALDVPIVEKKLTAPWFIFGLLITFWGGITSGISIFLHIARPFGSSHWRQRWGISWLLGIAMGIFWQLGASNMLLFLFVLQLGSNYALRHRKKFCQAMRIASLYGILFLSAFILPALLCGIPEILHAPIAYLIHLPQFIFQWPFLAIYNYAQAVKLTLFPAYTLELQLSWQFLAVVLVELILPGITLSAVQWITIRGVRWLRRPWTFTGLGTINPQQMGLLGLLAVVLAAIVYQRVADGLLAVAVSKGVVALQMVGLFLLLPVSVIVLGVRSRLFQSLENRL